MKVQRAESVPLPSPDASTPRGTARARVPRGAATFPQTLAGASGRSADDGLALRWPEAGGRYAQGWGRIAHDLGLVLGHVMRERGDSESAGGPTGSAA